MNISILTPPAVEPIHLDAARAHLKVDAADDNALIAAYLQAAREEAEDRADKQLIAARLEARFDHFYGCLGSQKLSLRKGPVIEIEAINYIDTAGNWQTLPSADYVGSTCGQIYNIVPADGKRWPATQETPNCVSVVYKAGYVCQATVDSVANTVALSGWKALQVNEVLRLQSSGGNLPAPLESGTGYYVQSVVSPGVYRLSMLPSGSAIDLTSAGSGYLFAGQPLGFSPGVIPAKIIAWMLLRTETAYSFRGEVANARDGAIQPIPMADRLLDYFRVF